MVLEMILLASTPDRSHDKQFSTYLYISVTVYCILQYKLLHHTVELWFRYKTINIYHFKQDGPYRALSFKKH